MAYGHIPGARGLPVDLSQHEVFDLLKGVDRSRPVIIYCQSKGCHFSDRMAIVLSGFGFDDIRIYPEGWMGWRATYSNEVTKE
jgi:rhodanese-related sulfurtransferase